MDDTLTEVHPNDRVREKKVRQMTELDMRLSKARKITRYRNKLAEMNTQLMLPSHTTAPLFKELDNQSDKEVTSIVKDLQDNQYLLRDAIARLTHV